MAAETAPSSAAAPARGMLRDAYDLLVDHVGGPDAERRRYSLIFLAFGSRDDPQDRDLAHSMILAGTDRDFAAHVVRRSFDHGRLSDGTPALSALP